MIDEIRKLKIALTSECSLRCSHCNIDKSSKLVLSKEMAFRAVDLLLTSKGKYKRLELYGGEPFLRFKLLRDVVDYAFKKALLYKKEISVNISTNATIITEEILNWLKKKSVIIAVSFSGNPFSHNFNRRFENSMGSYEVVVRNFSNILNTVGPERVVVTYCIDPGFVKNAFLDFRKIISLGVEIVNIECVHGVRWEEKDYLLLRKNLERISSYIIELAKKGRFIFAESFIEFFKNRGVSIPDCPGYIDMEVYPDGGIGFYPYAFIDYEREKDNIAIGDLKNGIYPRYRDCRYGGRLCRDCRFEYYRIEGLDDGSYAYHHIRERVIRSLFRRLLQLRKDGYIKRYFIELKKRMDIFYGRI